MNRVILATSCMVGYSYGVEAFTAWYSGNPYEWQTFRQPRHGPVRLGLRDYDPLQRAGAAVVLAAELADDAVEDDDRRPGGQRRHVDGAIRHHRRLAQSRLPAVELAYLHADVGRSLHVGGEFRTVFALCSSCSAAICRWWRWPKSSRSCRTSATSHDAIARNNIRRRRRRGRRSRSGCWRGSTGPEALLAAAARLRDEGFRRWDAMSPFPDPRHGAGDGHPADAAAVAGAGGGDRRGGRRAGLAVVDQRRRLPHAHQRQADVQPAGRHSRHFRVDHAV